MTQRPTRDEMLMAVAELVAERSTCDRLMVGAVIARSGRVLTSGYNGAPSGMAHCNHTCTCPTHGTSGRMIVRLVQDHHEDGCPSGPCNNTIHAEANAIVFAARHGVATENAEMFITHAPCLVCARLIINAGIMGVMFLHEYRDMSGVQLLKSQAVPVIQV